MSTLSFQKFALPSYTGWDEIDAGILKCTKDVDMGPMYRNEYLCWSVLGCVLDTSDARQQSQFSSAATVLGLVRTLCPEWIVCSAYDDHIIASHSIVTDGHIYRRPPQNSFPLPPPSFSHEPLQPLYNF